MSIETDYYKAMSKNESNKPSWGIVFLAFIWGIGNAFLKALLIQKYFQWFIITTFHTPFLLEYKQAMALSFFTSILFVKASDITNGKKNSDDSEYKPLIDTIVVTFAYVIVLGISWLWYKLYFA